MFNLVNCPIQPSRTLLLLYLGVHLLALIYVSGLDVELFVKLVLSGLTTLIFLHSFSVRVLLRSPDAVTALTWLPDDKVLRLQLGGFEWVQVTAIRQKVVTPVCVYMLLDVEERMFPIPVTLFADSSSKADFRRLKVLVGFATLNAETSASKNSQV